MNRKYSLVVFVVALALLLNSSGAIAQEQGPQSPQGAIGTAFTYQGQLKNASGLVNDQCDFQFSVWDAFSGGAALASDLSHTSVAVSNGLFTVQLDFGLNVFTGNARWVEIAVRCPASSGSYVTLTPRQPLTPAPYALFSTSTGALQGRSIATTAPVSGQVLKWNGSMWSPAVDLIGSGSDSWSLTGNAGTKPNTNFLGTTDNVSLTLVVSGTPALRLFPDPISPNVIGGYRGNIVDSGISGATIGGGGASGNVNRAAGNFATVGGGFQNIASGQRATVGGGGYNTASSINATIGGGYGNTASNDRAAVGGGGFNIASNLYSTIGGGYANIASGAGAFVGGGGYNGTAMAGNQALGNVSMIGGGLGNVITPTASYASIVGGQSNTANVDHAAIGGGGFNTANGAYSTIGGGGSNLAGDFVATVGGGNHNTATGDRSTVSGGEYNTSQGSYDSISGGHNNLALPDAAHACMGRNNIGGGEDNTVQGRYNTVSGGRANAASGGSLIEGSCDGGWNVVGGGQNNSATSGFASISGGENNVASGWGATVGGGGNNTASSAYATVPGGYYGAASHYGQMAYAAGAFANRGDAQTSMYVLRRLTTDALPQPLYLDGSGALLTVPANRAMTFDIQVVARSNANLSAGYQLRGVIENDGGTTKFVGTPSVTTLGEDVSTWDVIVQASDTYDALSVIVTGVGGTTIRWVATVRTAEVAW